MAGADDDEEEATAPPSIEELIASMERVIAAIEQLPAPSLAPDLAAVQAFRESIALLKQAQAERKEPPMR